MIALSSRSRLARDLDEQPPCVGSRQWQGGEAAFGVQPDMVLGVGE